jgi:hypothetical protein
MKLDIINLENHTVRNSIYQINLYPDKTFVGEKHVILYGHESWGNYQYYNYFRECDENNIKVIVYCTYVLLPVATLIGHEVRCHKAKMNHFWSGIGTYGFDHKLMRNTFDFNNDTKDYNVYDMLKKKYELGLTCSVKKLCKYFEDKTMFLDEKAVDNFKRYSTYLPTDAIWIVKKSRYNPVFDRVKKECDFKYFTKNEVLEILNHAEGQDYLLSYQILTSIFSNVKHIGFGGVASLFTVTPFINCPIMGDRGHNVDDKGHYFKTFFNELLFDEPTHNFHHIKHQRSFHLDKLRIDYLIARINDLSFDKKNLNLNIGFSV